MDYAYLIVLRRTDLLQRVTNTEASRQTTRRVVLEGLDEFPDDTLRRNEQVGTPEHPFVIVPARAVHHRLLVGIRSQIGDAREAMRRKGWLVQDEVY